MIWQRLICLLFTIAIYAFIFSNMIQPAKASGSGDNSAVSKSSEVIPMIIFHNGRIYTMDACRQWARALAVDTDGRICAVGSDEKILSLKDSKTKLVDLGGRLVLPGLHDSHVHLVDGGITLSECKLDQCDTEVEILAKIKDYTTNSNSKQNWLLGNGWKLPVFENANPHKNMLDSIESNRPIYLLAQDFHSAWVNSKALELAGIDKHTPDPEGGRIERDEATGEPTGTLRESAMHLVSDLIPKKSADTYYEGFLKGQDLALEYGITSIQDAWVSPPILDAYLRAREKGKLKLRVATAIKIDPEQEDETQIAEILKFKKKQSNGRLQISSAKIFADGVIEAKTAALLEPYLNKTSKCCDCGKLNFPHERLISLVKNLEEEGIQVHVHAIGDQAVRSALDAFEASMTDRKMKDNRSHVAHLQLVSPDDLHRFAALDISCNIQGYWAQRESYITDLTEPILGEERSKRIYPFGSLRNAGARIVGGSDWPVTTLNPFYAIEVAHRRIPEGETGSNSWLPQERLSIKELIEAYTVNGAFINHLENETGSLEVGKQADLIVLDRDIFECPKEEIHSTKVLLTMIAGEVVWSTNALAGLSSQNAEIEVTTSP